jgi:hypothetical protein
MQFLNIIPYVHIRLVLSLTTGGLGSITGQAVCGGHGGNCTCFLGVLRFHLPLISSTSCSIIIAIYYAGLVQ